MAKGFELIYSVQKTGFEPGRAYSNPRFFISPREGVTKVYVVGNWPAVVKGYQERGVPVVVVADIAELILAISGKSEVLAPPSKPADLERPKMEAAGLVAQPHADPDAIAIPDDWRELSWPKLRSLAAGFASSPVLNKALAVAAITAELNRRANALDAVA